LVGGEASVFSYKPPPKLVHPVIVVSPVIIGSAPMPYAPIVMMFPVVPEAEMVIDSKNVSPLLNKIESPGLRLEKKEFSLFIVFQGVEGF
jgi:hypothetical protein